MESGYDCLITGAAKQLACTNYSDWLSLAFSIIGMAYVGWLITNAQFCDEQRTLLSSWGGKRKLAAGDFLESACHRRQRDSRIKATGENPSSTQ